MRRSALAFVSYTVLMLFVERRMRKTGGPGIVALELAGSAPRADDIMHTWGAEGVRWARVSLWLDFGYMLTYGTLVALLIERVRSDRGDPIALRLLPIGAIVGDAVEGVALLKVLNATGRQGNARRARFAALTKFTLLALALIYAAVRLTTPHRRVAS